jgi:ketosteroid isomerase-like protein
MHHAAAGAPDLPPFVDQFAAAWVRRDLAAILACYTPSAKLFPPDAKPIGGERALREHWTQALAEPPPLRSEYRPVELRRLSEDEILL